jgi:signal transduction histidine kinase
MAEELSSRTRALEAADITRRQLLADVSHELMTPLTGDARVSRNAIDGRSSTSMLRLASAICRSFPKRRIVSSTSSVICSTSPRLEGGGSTMRQERVDVAALFDRVAARHENELRQRNVRLDFHVGAGGEHVIGDPDRLEQALQNLAANALRHTPDGGQITLTSGSDPRGVRLTVRDTGPGIPREHLPLIFERFYKADAARKAAGGSGLGLSIVKAIVERHGGHHHRAE